jgi:tetratricopeptide (TPR) repeat protein
MDCIRRFAWMAASVWLVTSAPAAMAQSDGTARMLAGNAAFRAGNFAAAIESYREALAAGLDTSLLRYNLGVAHYRLGEFAEAELALQRASGDPRLEALATYNLGLTAMAGGWSNEAERHFEHVLSVSSDPALNDLATLALDRLRVAQAQNRASIVLSRRRPREPEPAIGELDVIVAARYGADDNIYRSPSSAYVDLSQPGQPTIVPIKQSAGFMPVDMLVGYRIEAPEQSTVFDFVYRLNGDFYDSEFSNANQLTQRFEMGADLLLEGRHERRFDAVFFAVSHDETNFDPDTGVDREVAGQDVSDRFSYQGAGLTTRYDQVLPRWAFGFDTRLERRSYDSVPIVIPYSHEFYHLDLWVERSIDESTSLFFALDAYRREYDARRARDRAGVLSLANPTLEYEYTGAHVGAERRLSASFTLTASYRRVARADNFEGYGDYTLGTFELGLEYRPSRRARLGIAILNSTYDYPSAFAFNDPAGGVLDIDTIDAEIDFEYRFNGRISIWSEFLLRDESSTDPRLTYARNLAIVGLKWRH